ncbi:MAG: DUF1573 domain-containing protein [Verrucomicrobiae bacterium]|nr:DUF1573 domain-containing protein [Verrucomicrobiae bacterium]
MAAVADEPGRIAFDEPGLDFGTVDQQATATRLLTVRNVGAGTLRIIDLVSDCGCARTEPDVREIPPGGAGQLKITFLSGNLLGSINKTVTVRSSDPVHPAKDLFIRANVVPVFVFTPPMLDFGKIERGRTAGGEVVLRETQGKPFLVRRVVTPTPDVAVACEPIAGSHGAAYRLKIALAAPRKPGPAFFNIVLETDRAERPNLQLMVMCDVVGPVRVSPSTVFLGMGLEGTLFAPKTITVRNTGPAPIEIKSVDPGHPSLRATVTPVVPGREFNITLTMQRPLPVGSERRTMRIVTTDSDEPVEVALVAIVRKRDPFGPSP